MNPQIDELSPKAVQIFEIEEKKLGSPLLLPETQSSPSKPILHDQNTSNFDLTLSQIKELLQNCDNLMKKGLIGKDSEIVVKVTKTLRILQSQYQMIEDLYSLRGALETTKMDLEVLEKKYDNLGQFLIKLNSIEDFCLPILLKIDPFFLDMMKHFERKLKKLQVHWQTSRRGFYFNFLYIYGTKFNYIAEFLPFIVAYPNDDILCKEKSHPDWQEILAYYTEQELVTEQVMLRQLKKFGDALNTTSAVYFDEFRRRNKCCKSMKMLKDAIYYFCSSKRAKNVAHLFYAEPDVQTAVSVWNIPDKTFVKKFMKMGYPCIKIAKRIYLERTVESITLESILKEYANDTINRKFQKELDSPPKQPKEVTRPLNTLYHRGPDNIKVRLLSHRRLTPGVKVADTLLIHIHGGGFISMSSYSHQCYTRLFAKRTGVPVFSIDYRLAPDAAYPLGFDDCWQAYNWLLVNSFKYFGVEPKHIIICGDSAGGNLAAAITIACIKKGVRKPDGLLLMYPALNTSNKGFTPSYMKAFVDVVLQHTFLKICLNSYVKDERLKPEIDPYLSPRMASDEILMEFPPVRITSAGRDPLSDDSLKFLQRMLRLKKDISMKTYKGLPHGFMNYDYVGGLGAAKLAINDTCILLNDLLKYVRQRNENEA